MSALLRWPVPRWPLRLWPESLAGRLVLLLVATLAGAQLLLALLLWSHQDAVIAHLVRGQALSQTVTLARLLDSYPASESATLMAAFRSKGECAELNAAPPAPHLMSPGEADLAALLARMLHGVRAGAPDIAIAPEVAPVRPCGEADGAPFAWAPQERPERAGRPPGPGRHRMIAVAITVPLYDRGWLTLRTAVAAPGGWSRTTFLSFLVSSLAVALVTIVCVRLQTRSLRVLAEASDRFGRGESVPPLDVSGPSEVAAATRAFNTMQERLSQFLRDRLRLLASISHDLRTPLTTLRLKAEFVDDPEVREDIIATIDELTAICEATLAFSRAEAESEPTAKVDLNALCADLAEEFALSGAEVLARTGAPVMVSCRPVALKRAVRNLVENAVRYGGAARLVVAPGEAGGAVVTVDDDGPGLPADRIEEAFQPFVRLEESRSPETGGIGLGLAVARSIVKAHGGELTLANRPEGGLRAQIRLP